jgi:hypothetical protein
VRITCKSTLTVWRETIHASDCGRSVGRCAHPRWNDHTDNDESEPVNPEEELRPRFPGRDSHNLKGYTSNIVWSRTDFPFDTGGHKDINPS